jgi:hypothetical protein
LASHVRRKEKAATVRGPSGRKVDTPVIGELTQVVPVEVHGKEFAWVGSARERYSGRKASWNTGELVQDPVPKAVCDLSRLPVCRGESFAQFLFLESNVVEARFKDKLIPLDMHLSAYQRLNAHLGDSLEIRAPIGCVRQRRIDLHQLEKPGQVQVVLEDARQFRPVNNPGLIRHEVADRDGHTHEAGIAYVDHELCEGRIRRRGNGHHEEENEE